MADSDRPISEKPLAGSVALVAGATRGAGRAIAMALGEAGATVYCSGRSSRNRSIDEKRPETIEETAELVTSHGGIGVAVRTDHSDGTEVAKLIDRIQAEQKRLDILINDIWGGEELTEWGVKLWELDVDKGLRMLRNAIDTHIITSRYAVPLMLESTPHKDRKRLIIEITDGDGLNYRGNFFYDIAKTTVIRLAFAQASELREHEIAAIAVTPGFLRSEVMLEYFGVTEANWRDGAQKDEHFIASETPLFVGRAIAALAADPGVMQKSGRVFASWTLSDEYGFCDRDGARPHWRRHLATKAPELLTPELDEKFWQYLSLSSSKGSGDS